MQAAQLVVQVLGTEVRPVVPGQRGPAGVDVEFRKEHAVAQRLVLIAPEIVFQVDQAFVAVVELEEGPRMMSNILECEQTPEALQLDMPLEVTFEKLTDEITLPQFRPAR